MDSKQTVMALYGAYATGDAVQIAGLLHDEVVWTAPAGNATQVALGLGRPEDAGPPRGANDLDREAIVAFMAHNFARFFGGVDNEFRGGVWPRVTWSLSSTDYRPRFRMAGPMSMTIASYTRCATARCGGSVSTWTLGTAGPRYSAKVNRSS